MGEIEELPISEIGLMPNPASDFISIETGEVADHVVNVIDMSGKSVLSTVLSSRSGGQINLQALPSGVYLIQVITNGEIKTDRFMIDR